VVVLNHLDRVVTPSKHEGEVDLEGRRARHRRTGPYEVAQRSPVAVVVAMGDSRLDPSRVDSTARPWAVSTARVSGTIRPVRRSGVERSAT
jgi:hypothetical protein